MIIPSKTSDVEFDFFDLLKISQNSTCGSQTPLKFLFSWTPSGWTFSFLARKHARMGFNTAHQRVKDLWGNTPWWGACSKGYGRGKMIIGRRPMWIGWKRLQRRHCIIMDMKAKKIRGGCLSKVILFLFCSFLWIPKTIDPFLSLSPLSIFFITPKPQNPNFDLLF